MVGKPAADEETAGGETDPRDLPAPLGLTVCAALGGAVLLVILRHLFGHAPYGGRVAGVQHVLLPGPLVTVLLVLFQDVWWKRWWALAPAAVLGCGMMAGAGRLLTAAGAGDGWAVSVAYVAVWTLSAFVFAYGTRFPRTDFTSARRHDGESGGSARPVAAEPG